MPFGTPSSRSNRDGADGPGKKKKLLDRVALQSYAIRLLSGRAMSIGELREKLKVKAADPAADVDPVLSELKQYGYLNDRAFADSFAAARRDNQSFGKMRVLRDLRVKRVPSTVADQAVQQAFEGKDEVLLIEQFLERKFRGVDLKEAMQDEKKLASAFRRLRTAGYSTGNSIRVLKRYAAQGVAEQLENLDQSEDGEPE
jgi:regulatory protein